MLFIDFNRISILSEVPIGTKSITWKYMDKDVKIGILTHSSNLGEVCTIRDRDEE